MRKKLSIIIPLYNTEKYIKSCLNSVIRQTLKEIEVILVDDGSTDNSCQICQEVIKNDNRVLLFRKKNEGPAAARNYGIKLAKGEYLTFLDADDFYYSKYSLSLLYTFAKANNVKICGGEFLNYDDITKKAYQDFNYSNKGYLFEKNELSSYTSYQFDYGFHRFVYDRKFILKNQLYFPNYFHFEDPPFLVKALSEAKYFYKLDIPVYIHRVSHKQVTWNPHIVTDLLKGILDNVLYSKANNLYNLFDLSYIRLHQKFHSISPFLNEDSFNILKKLKQINPYMTQYFNLENIQIIKSFSEK